MPTYENTFDDFFLMLIEKTLEDMSSMFVGKQ